MAGGADLGRELGRRLARGLVLDELDAEHQAPAPGLADDGRVLFEALERLEHGEAETVGAGGQSVVEHEAQRGGAGGVGHDVAPEGADVLAARHGVEALLVGDARDGKAQAAQGLAHGDDVGESAGMLEGEELARPAEPGLDLVDDEEDVVLVADRADGRQPAVGRDDRAPFALDGLDEDGGGFGDPGVGVLELVFEVGGAVQAAAFGRLGEGAAVAVGVGQEMDLGEERQEIGPERLAACEGERAGGHAVVGALEGDQGDAAGVVLGQLDGAFDGVGPGRTGEEQAAELGGEDGAQGFDQRLAGRAGDVERVRQVSHLVAGGIEDRGVRVADVEDPGAAEEIDVDVAVDVLDRGPAAAAQGHGQAARVGDGRAFVPLLEFEEGAGPGPGRG